MIKAWRQLEKQADWLAVGLLLFFFWRLLAMAAASSPTMDEVLHVFHGVVYWRVSPQHILYNITNNPPLVNALIGIPVNLVLWPTLPLEPAIWGIGAAVLAAQTFMWETNTNGLEIIWVGRVAVMLLALLLGALLYRWGKELYAGKRAALLALLLYTFDPNVLAHGALATIDLGTALFLFVAAYVLWRYWCLADRTAPAPQYSVTALYLASAVAIGAVLAAKFSGMVILPAVALMAAYRVWTQKRPSIWRTAVAVLGWFFLAAPVFLAIYRFDLVMLQHDLSWQGAHQLAGHPAFLLGQVSQQGWWYYFPIVFAIKTPLATLFLLGLGLLLFARQRRYGWPQLWLLLVAGGIGAASLTTRVNIGYRYLLPLLPPLYLFLGQLAQTDWVSSRFLRPAIGASVLWLAAASLSIHPHYLAYFNRLAGGPENGWHVVVDSNIDWGQDIQALGQYVAENGIESVKAMWLAIAPSEVYGIEATPLYDLTARPEQNELYGYFYPARPAPGVYVLSVSHLQGVFEPGPELLQWFRERAPDDKVGYSLLVYDVKADGPATGVALSGIGLSVIAPDDFDRAFASNDVRPRWYDARSNVLWPGGSLNGKVEQTWAAVGDAHFPAHPLLQAFYPPESPALTGQSENHEGRVLRYGLYQWQSSPVQALLAQPPPGHAAYHDFGWSPEPAVGSFDWETKRQPLASAAIFSDTLQLLGYSMPEALQPGAGVDLLTYWHVLEPPPADLKIFLHLVDATGQVVAQHDGLDLRSEALLPGDEFAQLHTVHLPADLADGHYAWQIGLYDRRSGERLFVPTAGGPADRLLLHAVSIGDR